VVVIFNAIFTALAYKYMWYVDMTENELYTLSDAAIELISDVDKDITIYFCQDPDELEADTAMRYVYNTAKQMDNHFDNINVVCEDIVVNNKFFEKFSTAANSLKTTSVIVESGSEFRAFAIEAFYVTEETSGEVRAYNGELKLCSAILQTTTAEIPMAYFTTGHGEALDAAATPLVSLFYDAGFAVEPIDLSTADLSDDARIVVINNPVYDFIGSEAEDGIGNEIEKLNAFLDNYGALIVFADPENAGNYTNLGEFLSEWGIEFVPNAYVRDSEHAVSTDALSIVGEYNTENALAASLYSTISSLSSMPKVVFRKAMPINVLFEEQSTVVSTRMVSPIMSSYDTSELVVDGEVVGSGKYQLMTLSQEITILNNEYYYSYVLVCGTSDYAAANYLVSNAYANSDILYSAMRAFGKEKVPAEIEYKFFEKYDMEITTAEANRWTTALVTVIPAILTVCGIYVWIRRKYS